MRRKEQIARSVSQDNDAGGHSPRPNGHKARSSLKRQASKRLRQALAKEDRQVGNCLRCGKPLDIGIGYDEEFCVDCIKQCYTVEGDHSWKKRYRP